MQTTEIEALTGEEILVLKLKRNDAKARTVRDYLKALLVELWEKDEGFSGKRPFGNSGWSYELFAAFGDPDSIDLDAAGAAIYRAIDAL